MVGHRYYNPEWGRWIQPDDIEYLDASSINGLNLYAYCANNPVMNIDPDGHAWYNVLGWIGVGLVAAAAIVLSCGAAGVAIGGAGMAGAIIHGAAVGTLIGAAAGAAVGAGAGAIYSGVTGADMGSSIWAGVQAGFGIGAIAGAIIGGTIGGVNYHSAQALMNSYNMPNHPNFDCSEVADDLYGLANGKGRILNISSKNNLSFNVYSQGDDFLYHSVYNKGRYILDPRYSSNPVTKSAYMKALRALNQGISFVF